MQTKLKIKGLENSGLPEGIYNPKREIELTIEDLKSQHPELWLGEEEIKNIVMNLEAPNPLEKGKRSIVAWKLYWERIAKALVGKCHANTENVTNNVTQEPKSTELIPIGVTIIFELLE
jgi:hypothetical protein